LHAPARRIRPDRADISRAAAMIARAKRPLIIVGGGIHLSAGFEAFLAFAAAQSIPVAHTMNGKAIIACMHPLRSSRSPSPHTPCFRRDHET
jgi:acetolactate synthase I/II/III large subunit